MLFCAVFVSFVIQLLHKGSQRRHKRHKTSSLISTYINSLYVIQKACEPRVSVAKVKEILNFTVQWACAICKLSVFSLQALCEMIYLAFLIGFLGATSSILWRLNCRTMTIIHLINVLKICTWLRIFLQFMMQLEA